MARPGYSVLMVCTANICRSPMAATLLTHLLQREGLAKQVSVDSAGIRALKGQRPDQRALDVVASRGIRINRQRSRQFVPEDYAKYDLILCMDRSHLSSLEKACPDEHRQKISLIMEFASEREEQEVPDPYFGNVAGFVRVLDLLESANQGLVRSIRRCLENEGLIPIGADQ